MSGMFPMCMLLVKGCSLSDLGHGPNKPTATIIGEYTASYHHGALTFTLIRARIPGCVKNLATFLATHHIDVWHVPSLYVTCKGLSDLGNGPNKPTATIIGQYSASLQDAALVFTLVRA